MSNSLDIAIDQGSSLTYVFTLKNPDGTAFNLTGFDARMQVRKTYGDTTVQINCTLANSKIALTSAIGGILTLSLLPADTSSIRFNAVNDDELDCVYDLEIVDPVGNVYKPAKGAFIISREVTR